nr:hypothetical protein Iba_chr09cCG1560 [Ipomoea batatas]
MGMEDYLEFRDLDPTFSFWLEWFCRHPALIFPPLCVRGLESDDFLREDGGRTSGSGHTIAS